jgi:hypothetical protein
MNSTCRELRFTDASKNFGPDPGRDQLIGLPETEYIISCTAAA